MQPIGTLVGRATPAVPAFKGRHVLAWRETIQYQPIRRDVERVGQYGRLMKGRYLRSLSSAVSDSAAAYGYTLTVWSSGAVMVHVWRPPDIVDVAVFLGGAVAAFALVEALATRVFRSEVEAEPGRVVVIAGALHFVSAGLAVACAYGLALVIGTEIVAWLCGSFAATAVYFLMVGVQVSFAEWRTGREPS